MTPLTIDPALQNVPTNSDVRLAVVEAGPDRPLRGSTGSVIVRLRLGAATGAGGGQAAGHAQARELGEEAVRGEEAHQRPGEEPGDDHVEDRGEAEEEGEAAHRADGEHGTAATAPMKLEMSAARIVRKARVKARSVELRSVRPACTSSLSRSKYTT